MNFRPVTVRARIGGGGGAIMPVTAGYNYYGGRIIGAAIARPAQKQLHVSLFSTKNLPRLPVFVALDEIVPTGSSVYIDGESQSLILRTGSIIDPKVVDVTILACILQVIISIREDVGNPWVALGPRHSVFCIFKLIFM